MKEFKNIDEIKIGEFVIDTYNEFNKKDFKFIQGQEYNPSLSLCEIVDKTETSVCVRLEKFPLSIIKSNGALTNPVSCNQWYKFKREHEYEIGFLFRFKKQ